MAGMLCMQIKDKTCDPGRGMTIVKDLLTGIDRSLPKTKRGQKTRAKLLEAAVSVFGETGVEGASVALIAERAGVAHGSFYNYFQDLDDILVTVLLSLYQDLREGSGETAARQASTRRDILIENATAFFRRYAQRRHLMRLAREAAARPDSGTFVEIWLELRRLFIDRTQNWIERLQQTGEIPPGRDADLLAEALGAMNEQLAYVHICLPTIPPSAERIEELGRICGDIWYAAIFLGDTPSAADTSAASLLDTQGRD